MQGWREENLSKDVILKCSCSQAQRIKEPQAQMTVASEMLTYSGGESRPSVSSQKTIEETDQKGRIRKERGPRDFII